MTGPRVDFGGASEMVGADAHGVPQIGRVLSPDEFDQMKQLNPAQLARVKLPAVPPVFAPKDQTKRLDPNADRGASTGGAPLTGLAGILTRNVAAPMLDNPLTSLATVLVPGAGVALAGSMIHDIAAYAGQKAAELSMSPEDRAKAEADPSRIGGESVAVQAAMLALAPLIRGAVKGIRGAGEAVAGGLGAFHDPEIAGMSPRPPLDPMAHPVGAQLLGSLAGRAGMGPEASPYTPGTPLHDAWSEGHAQGVENAQMAAVHGDHPSERFSGLPVTADLRARVAEHMSAAADMFNAVFAPDNVGPDEEAGQAGRILRANLGQSARRWEMAAGSVNPHGGGFLGTGSRLGSSTSWATNMARSFLGINDFRTGIDILPEADKLGFVDAIETGNSQPTPAFQKPADAMRAAWDSRRQAIQDLGTGKLQSFIDNYYSHSGIWADPEDANARLGIGSDEKEAAAIERARLAGGGSMEGNKSFLKQRTIPTVADGIARGVKLKDGWNPVDIALASMRNMDRYLMAHQTLNEWKDAGLIKYVRAGAMAPDGYVRINDKVATVFGPREGAVTLPEGANIEQGDVGVPGRRIMGEYYAPAHVARIANNYMSPGMRGAAAYDLLRGIGNTLNQAQLGLSGFHIGTTSIIAAASRMALGLQYLKGGEFAKGAEALATTPAAPISSALHGAKLRAEYLRPGVPTPALDWLNKPILGSGTSPDYAALANLYAEGGGRAVMDSWYKNTAPERMVTAWNAGGVMGKAKAGALSIPTLLDAVNRPTMEHWVPMQKAGAFAELATRAMEELPEDATIDDFRAAASTIQDSIDNRYGQMVYDNLFWNKTFKDLAMLSTRSLGWNLGSIRELAGGAVDLVKMSQSPPAAGAPFEGSTGELSPRAAFTMAYPMVIGMLGATYQYLMTGKGPEELKDYFYPQNGGTTPDGNPDRSTFPGFWQDVPSYVRDPWGTLKNKSNPMLSTLNQMLRNEDYYHREIMNRNDPWVKQAMQEAAFIGRQAEPLSVRNMLEAHQRGDDLSTEALAAFGVKPAPNRAIRTNAENAMAQYLALRGSGGGTPEDQETQDERRKLLGLFREHDDPENSDADQARRDKIAAMVTHDLNSGRMVRSQVAALLKEARSTPDQERFRALRLPEALDVFERGTMAERQSWGKALQSKIRSARARGIPIPPFPAGGRSVAPAPDEPRPPRGGPTPPHF